MAGKQLQKAFDEA